MRARGAFSAVSRMEGPRNGSWSEEQVRAAMHGSKMTFQVSPRGTLSTLLVYATAVVVRSGEVHFASDIYLQDALLENRLGQSGKRSHH